jgi:RNA polymerase sigma-70 factor (ECF subfamily)
MVAHDLPWAGWPALRTERRPAMMVEETDELLMRRIAERDEHAFRRLADRHLDRILALARKLMGSAAASEDVAQEALLRIWLNAAGWRPEKSRLSTWIYTITYRLCLDRLRSQRTQPLDDAFELADPAPGAFEALALAEERHRLAAAMAALQPRQRAAVTLFYYEELSGPDAAAVLGLSLRAFWSLLHRARQSIQQQISPSLAKAPTP